MIPQLELVFLNDQRRPERIHLEVLRRTLRKGCEDACNLWTIALDGSGRSKENPVVGAKRIQRCDENSIRFSKVFDAFGQLRMYVNIHFKRKPF
jgi:hypothetical protein